MSADKSKKDKARRNQSLSTARLAAVQALYEIELSDAPREEVLLEFMGNRWNLVCQELDERDDEKETVHDLVSPDGEMLGDLVRGVLDDVVELDRIIEGAVAKEWHAGRMEVVLRCILRAGVYELLSRPDVPAKVVTCEYLDVAKAFYSDREPGLVNAVLDTIAHRLRTDEMNKHKKR